MGLWMRAVSVLPSATEIVCALGHAEDLVGRSAECDYPPEILDRPVVMHPKTWDAESPSSDIDRRVRASRERGESLYELDVELLKGLQPDVLLTQDLCGVCSVTDEEITKACSVAGITPRVVSLSPTSLSAVASSFETVGSALGCPAAGKQLSERFNLTCLPARSGARPRVAVVEWLDPPILAGLWTPDIVGAAGGTSLGVRSQERGKRTTWGEITKERPDLMIISPCSFSVERTLRELHETPRLISAIRAVKPRLGTHIADEAYFSRPGPRLAHGVGLVRALLNRASGTPPLPVVPFDLPTSGSP